MTKDRVLPLPVGAETQMSLGRYPPCPIKYPLDALWRMAGITSACTGQNRKQTLTTELTGLNPVHPDKQLYTMKLFSHLCCCCYRHKRGKKSKPVVKRDNIWFCLALVHSWELNTEYGDFPLQEFSYFSRSGCYSVKYCFQLIPVSLFSH